MSDGMKFIDPIAKELIVKHIEKKTNQDSLSFGSASKGGIIKCYSNFSDVEDFKKKIDNAIEVRKYAQQQVDLNV